MYSRSATSPVLQPSLTWAGSLSVPGDFMGMHFHRWPEGSPLSAAPRYRFDVASSVDYAGVFWPNLNPSEGVYDWTRLDPWVGTHFSAGRRLSFTVYRTPQWAASDTSHSDAYGGVGGGSNPTSLTHVADFVTALVSRYNAISPGNPLGQKRIKYLKCWDEPSFSGSYSYSWWGTVDQFAALSNAIAQAARAVDPDIVILSPGMIGTNSTLITTLLNADAGSGMAGRDIFDGICVNPYAIHTGVDTWTGGQDISALTAQYRAAMVAGGIASDSPLYLTGTGVRPEINSPILTLYAGQPIAQWLVRMHLQLVLLGYRSVYWYSHDGPCVGRPETSVLISEKIDRLAQLSGRTMTRIESHRDEMIVTTSDGTVVV